MKKMRVGVVVLGKYYTLSPEEKKIKDHDLRESDAINLTADDKIVAEMSARVRALLPGGIDTFTANAVTENDALNLQDADVYVVVPFNVIDVVFAALHSKNRPIVVYAPAFAEFWSYGNVFYPYFMRDVRKIDAMIGIRPEVYLCKNDGELTEYVGALLVRFRIRGTKVLCIGEAMYEPYHSFNWGYEMVRLIQERYGVQWKHIGSDKFIEIFNNSEDGDGSLIAGEAKKNRMPEGYDLSNPEKTYRIYKKLIEETGANAFTVNCIESTVHTGCNTTSCYALSKLNDDGIVAACEADVTTLMNMLIVSYSSGSPAFMLNPYLFPMDDKLFVSHCTSPTKHSYDSEEKDEFNIYPYFEIRGLPCGLQVIKKPGPVTITGISHDGMDKMVIVRGELIRNTSFPSCRTQLEIDVPGGVKKLAECYEGRHWALVYGDQSRKIANANGMLGIESVVI
ncbi:MAG: hypothetical protein J5879_09630 [Clostridia bacterium]|nr:hypothetical protein [Clostridia bacterium]